MSKLRLLLVLLSDVRNGLGRLVTLVCSLSFGGLTVPYHADPTRSRWKADRSQTCKVSYHASSISHSDLCYEISTFQSFRATCHRPAFYD
eukprot:g13873.t1